MGAELLGPSSGDRAICVTRPANSPKWVIGMRSSFLDRRLVGVGLLLAVVVLLSACGDEDSTGPETVSTTSLPAATTTTTPTTTTTLPTSTTTLPTSTTSTTTAPPPTTTTTIPFPERLRPDLAAINLLVACLEESVAEMDVADLISALASELVAYNFFQRDTGFFELEAPFLRCLPELPVYASARVGVGEAVEGVLDYADDVDVFVFQAEENGLYRVSVDLGTLGDSFLTIYDQDETVLGSNDDYDGSLASQLVWRAPTGGDYYIAVEGYGAGTYMVIVELSDVVDDHPDRIDSEVSRVGVGETADGVIEYSGDVDMFVFEAVKGLIYRIDVDSLISPIVTVYNADGVQVEFSDWRSDGYLLSMKPVASGDYYIGVSADSDGSYTVVLDSDIDDYPDPGDAGSPVEVEHPLQGRLEYRDDIDVFVFEATENQTYQIRVELGTLTDSIVSVHSNGDQLAWNDDHEDLEDLSSLLVWEAPATGTYSVHVEGYSAGSYILTIQEIEPAG